VKTIGGTSTDYGRGVALDGQGNVYLTGSFYLSADFDPGAAVFTMTSSGGYDAYILKLTSATGDFVWAKKVGGTSTDDAMAIDVDASGNSYITGRYYSTVDFDPGPNTANLTSKGGADAFILKLDIMGDYVWAKSVGGISTDYAYAIAVDGIGNVYSTGYFYLTGDFNPGSGTANLTSAGGADMYTLKLNSSGNYVWAKSKGSTSTDMSFDISIDNDNQPYIVGYSYGKNYDIYIEAMDTSGSTRWNHYIGVGFQAYGQCIDIDDKFNVYIGGYFNGGGDFDPGPGTKNLNTNGSNDIFVLKFDQCLETSSTVTVTACNEHLLNGHSVIRRGAAYLFRPNKIAGRAG